MSNETYVTVRGFVGADPMVFSNGSGNRTVIVRVGVTPRNRNRQTQQYEDGPTVWYSVRCFGELAENVAQTIRTGAPVLVRGRLAQRTWEGRDGVERMELVITADSLGVELATVSATYAKSRRNAGADRVADPGDGSTPESGSTGEGVVPGGVAGHADGTAGDLRAVAEGEAPDDRQLRMLADVS